MKSAKEKTKTEYYLRQLLWLKDIQFLFKDGLSILLRTLFARERKLYENDNHNT